MAVISEVEADHRLPQGDARGLPFQDDKFDAFLLFRGHPEVVDADLSDYSEASPMPS